MIGNLQLYWRTQRVGSFKQSSPDLLRVFFSFCPLSFVIIPLTAYVCSFYTSQQLLSLLLPPAPGFLHTANSLHITWASVQPLNAVVSVLPRNGIQLAFQQHLMRGVSVSWASPYQAADGSAMGSWKVDAGRLKDTSWKTKTLHLKQGDDGQTDGEDWNSSKEQKKVHPFSFPLHIAKEISHFGVENPWPRV